MYVMQGSFGLVSIRFLLPHGIGEAFLQVRNVLVSELLVMLLYVTEM